MVTNMRMTIATAMTESVAAAGLYRLLAFLSPAFPIGAFTYSHGLEQVIEEGDVCDAPSLQSWLTDILTVGAGRSDAILLKATYEAAGSGDTKAVRDLIDLGLALQPTRERHLEASAQGTAFIATVSAAWTPPADQPAGAVFSELAAGRADASPESWPYSVAVGLTASAWSIDLRATLSASLHAFSANLISAAIRAVPLGQTDGQRILAAIEPVIERVADEAMASSVDDLGTCTFLADIASMAHETKYSRLFRS